MYIAKNLLSACKLEQFLETNLDVTEGCLLALGQGLNHHEGGA